MKRKIMIRSRNWEDVEAEVRSIAMAESNQSLLIGYCLASLCVVMLLRG